MTGKVKIQRSKTSSAPLVEYGELALSLTDGRKKLFIGDDFDVAQEITDASNIKNTPAGSITSTNIQGAINELAASGGSSSATTTSSGIAYLPKRIIVSNNSTDADHDIDFASGIIDFKF